MKERGPTGSAGRHLQKRGGERLNQRYSDIPAGQRLCREHRLAWLEKYTGPALPLRHLIRRPTHNPRRVLSIVLPCAVFNPEALRMVETDRRFVLLINLKAQPGVVPFDFIQQRPTNTLAGGARRNKQRADETGPVR